MKGYSLALPLLAFLTCSSPQLFAISPPPEVGKQTMVVTAQHEATDVGNQILQEGGNAVDAAVAIGYVSFPLARWIVMNPPPPRLPAAG
jgi:hypothetical protein